MRTHDGFIQSLPLGSIFVFGSNTAGRHGGGAARVALEQFSAEMGNPAGLQGQSYAIPTVDDEILKLPLGTVREHADRFLDEVRRRPDLTFYLTAIGCGIAGFSPEEIAPLFAGGVDLPNLVFPDEFARLLAD